jgi:hypothetical protein
VTTEEAQARAAGLTEAEIAALKLNSGAHDGPESGHCLLEVVSMFAREPFSDKPACVDYVLAEFGRTWNDGMRSDEEREQLKRYIVLLPGTAKGEALSQKRAFMAVDWAIRVYTPAWLDLSPALAEHTAKLRALAPITDEKRLAAAQSALDHARSAAAAAWAAARDAARAAARAAARDAARAAAWDAAWDAAWAAAWAAAWDAAWAAAWAAAQKVEGGYQEQYAAARKVADELLAPTTATLQESAHALYLSMIAADDSEAA